MDGGREYQKDSVSFSAPQNCILSPSSQAKAFYMKPNHMKFLKPPPPPHPLQPPPPHPSSHHMLRDTTGKRVNIFKATPPFPTFLVSSVQNPQLENRKTL